MVRNQRENRCFSCIGSSKRRLKSLDERYLGSPSPPHSQVLRRHSFSDATDHNRGGLDMDEKRGMGERVGSNRGFTLAELMLASNNFKTSQLIGEGGFGKVYKGILDNGQVVAIKRLNLDGLQGNQEFIIEVLLLSLLNHPNLVNLIGYCAEGDQRLLVYEYMPKGSLEDHLFGASIKEDKQVMDWNTRVKVAVGAAKGLEHLHCEAKPPIIYRDLKAANILLDKDFNPKLSDFGLAKLGPVGDKTHVSTRVMGTYGYCAPEYAMTGKLTLKSDIFSFGVLLLEIVTGKRTFDPRRKMGEHSLVASSRPYLKDRRKYMELIDPRLRGRYSRRSARHMIAVTTMCLSEEATQRPSIKEIVAALEFLATECEVPTSNITPPPSSGSSQLDYN